jgi:hypothetical protein
MKTVILVLLATLSFHTAFAGQGDACADAYQALGYGSNYSRDGLVQYCNEMGYTAAHAEAVMLYQGRTSTGANEIFAWVKDQSFTAAHISAARHYIKLGTDTGLTEILTYIKSENFTKKQVSCAIEGAPETVEKFTEWLVYCKSQSPAQ